MPARVEHALRVALQGRIIHNIKITYGGPASVFTACLS